MKELEAKILKYLQARGWDHLRPSDLAKSIMIEGAELLEVFQWENLPLEDIKKNKEKMGEIRKELADVLIYCLQMSALLELDADKIVRSKLAKAARKYPAKLMRKRVGEPGTEGAYLEIKAAHRKNK